MKHLLFTPILFLIFTTNLFAQQKQGAWWYFGQGAGVNFNPTPPIPDFSSRINQGYASTSAASISDANGNLLFYTDGYYIFNRNHLHMQNGLAMLTTGGLRAALIVQKPGSNFIYYLFGVTDHTLPANLNQPNLIYALIDMRLDNGKGGVIANTQKTIVYTHPVRFKLTAALHSNNRDTWLIAHSDTGSDFLSFLISPSGISHPVVSSAGFSYPSLTSGKGGHLKVSPKSNLLADLDPFNGIQLLDFNRLTGNVTNPRVVMITPPNPPNIYIRAFGFSPDESKLYVSENTDLFQYNLLAGSFPAVLASKFNINTNLAHLDMQLGLNGKLYLLPFNTGKNTGNPGINNPHLSVIHCANASGTAYGFQDTSIYLGASRFGGNFLPALNQTLFRNANILQLTATKPYICIGDSVKLSAFGAGADQFTWLPAVGLTQTSGSEVTVKPTTTTTYTVIGQGACDIDTARVTVIVAPPAVANAGPNKVGCSGSPVQLGTAAQPSFTYAWDSSPFLSDTTLANPTFTATNTTTSDQVYQLILTIEGPGVSCGKRTDTVQVTVKPQIIANAGAAVTTCSGNPVQLNPQQFNSNYSYSWSPATGLSNANTFAPTLTLTNFSAQSDTVLYTLMATHNGCTATSQVRIIVRPEPKPIIYGPPSVCPGSPQIAYTITNHLPINSYVWGVRGGTISHTFTDSIQVNWGPASNNAQVWVMGNNTYNCDSDTTFFPVLINPLLATEKPKGNATLCENDRLNQRYQIARAQGSTYTWGITGGTITSGQGSNQVNVNWNGPGQHKLWVQESAQTSLAQCFGVSDTLRITVLPSPDTTLAIRGPASVCHQSSQTYSLAGNSASN